MSTITYIVKVASAKFTIDDAVAPKLTFRDGDTYVFDQADSSNAGHVLQFSITSNNSGSAEYTTGVTKTGTAGSAGAKTTIITSGSTTDTLYYYSSGGGTYGEEFSNSGFNTSATYNLLKPIVGGATTAEKWGSMLNHAMDQIDQGIDAAITAQDLDGATDSGTVAVDLDSQSLTVAGGSGIATSGSGQTITVSVPNDGIDSQHYAADSIDAEHYAPASVDTTAMAASVIGVKPHIIPDKLYPAVAGKLLDNTASHSGAYGTVQADGFSYYYTDIKGSKPIKDPRIGAHFGSQRHYFRSIQLLEQETATHGENVYSIDGRNWARAVSGSDADWTILNIDSSVLYISASDISAGTNFLEITGYFNQANIKGLIHSSEYADDCEIFVNGGTVEASSISFSYSVVTPLKDRFVDSTSLLNLNLGTITTPQITTVKIKIKDSSSSNRYFRCAGIELIAQDRGSNSGSDLMFGSNAASMVSESNATTGWATQNLTLSTANISSDSTKPSGVGDYAITYTATGSGQYGGTSTSMTTVSGTRYKFTMHYKVTNGDSDTFASIGLGTAANGGQIYVSQTQLDSDWHTFIHEFTATTTTFYMYMQELAPADDFAVQIAGVSLFALSNTELSNIQIPAQNVVSFGKKFAIPATAQHYDPFDECEAGNNSSSVHSTFVDMDTSLGLDTAPGASKTWQQGGPSPSYVGQIRPYNGGRVVKWVDSTGAIKTSVNMMPPNSQQYNETASLEVNVPGYEDGYNAANNNTYNSSDDPIDHSQAEVAKTFHWREFGNGAANGGTGSANYPDASMLKGAPADDIAYVMDDGLTTLSAAGVTQGTSESIMHDDNDDLIIITFIGTGISVLERDDPSASTDQYDTFVDGVTVLSGEQSANTNSRYTTYAQNLPYGTHTLKLERTAVNAFSRYYNEFIFHQPKRPPIPEDACILADYMLMADWVAMPGGGGNLEFGMRSKGTRRVSASRDFFYDNASGAGAIHAQSCKPDPATYGEFGMAGLYTNNDDGVNCTLPYFGTQCAIWASHQHVTTGDDARLTTINGTALTHANTAHLVHLDSSSAVGHDASILILAQTVGVNKITQKVREGGYQFLGLDIAMPIHTSSHYQTFETPFLHELVGGDRNMEQTNLVVTPDGKTWDEVTRDTSYIGDTVMQLSCDGGGSGYNVALIFDEYRGFAGTQSDKFINTFNKDFAIAYDRQICLVDGEYSFYVASRIRESGTSGKLRLRVNGNLVTEADTDDGTWNYASISAIIHLKRGDYVQVYGGYWEPDYTINNDYYVRRLK